MAKREAVIPLNPHGLYKAHRYSAAISSGGFLFVPGQDGSCDGSPEPDFAKQVQFALGNLASVLKAAGGAFDNVVDVTALHTDPAAQFEPLPPSGSEPLAPPCPNWTAVGVTWLSSFDFEIKVIARPSHA